MSVNLQEIFAALKLTGRFVPYVGIAEQLIEAGVKLGSDMKALAAEAAVTPEQWANAKAENATSLDDEIVKLGGTIGHVDQPPPPPPPPPGIYDVWRATDPGDAALANGDYVYQRTSAPVDNPASFGFYVHAGGPLNFGFPGAPAAAELLRTVTK